MMKSKPWFFLILFAAFFLFAGCVATDVTEEEKALLITMDDVAATGVEVGHITEAGEKYKARRFINGTTEVEYEYDSENDPENSMIVIFYSEADTYRHEDLAVKAFDDAIDAYLLGAKAGGADIEVVEVPDHFTLGEQNYSAFLEVDGVRFGNIVVTQKGKVVYSLLLAGPHIKYSKTLHYLIGPKLDLGAE